MLKTNRIRTSKRVAKIASKLLKKPRTAKPVKSISGATLVNRRKK